MFFRPPGSEMKEIKQQDVAKAADNWLRWCCVFEHGGPAADNPLLADTAKFDRFLKEYSVRRTIRGGMERRVAGVAP